MLTGRPGASGADQTGKFPSIGSIVARACGPRDAGMPAYAAMPYGSSIGLRPGYFGANYLGREFNPFETDGDPNDPNFKVQDFQLPPDLTLDRLENRRTLRQHFDRLERANDLSGTMDAMDRFQRRPSISSPAAPPARRSTSAPSRLRFASVTAATTGARARCWPGGSSRPAARSSRSTSAAGTITGTCSAGWKTACRRSMRPSPACSPI